MRTYETRVRLSVLVCFLAVFSISPQLIKAQSLTAGNGKFEVGLGLGPSFFLGDLGGNRGVGTTFIKDVNLPLTKLMKGIYVNVYPTEWLGLRIAANSGQLEGYDSMIKTKGINEMERRKRNLGFRSNLNEVYGAIELYPTVFFEKYEGLEHKLRPYGLIGFGIFHFNPKAPYSMPDGSINWVELKPLHLEGQGWAEFPERKEYSLTQKEITMGGGFKYYLKENMYVGFEILHRKTFTDYVDDVSTEYIDPHYYDLYLSPANAAIARNLSYREKYYNPSINRPYINEQRGDPRQNDAFFSGMLRLGWRINGVNAPNSRAKRSLKCPVYY
ncbi:MAG: outer membrane beta-barrel protein [Chitinophagaceae bacterium]|nr:outer membrane beta-barrel protein [Chitinophagaceae bacterium]